jgi:transcriptional regulator with XRE-family HTH domain
VNEIMAQLREAFAQNLKRLVRKESSIAHVCRVLSINRQQFNRYLSAETLPNKHNLKTISDYFKVSEEALFASVVSNENIDLEVVLSDSFLESLQVAFSGECRNLRLGVYFYYFPYSTTDRRCFRGLLVVKNVNRKIRFEGLLSLRDLHLSPRVDSLLRYSGLVREKDGTVLFLGNMRGDPGNIFIMHVVPIHSSNNKLFVGIATSARAGAIEARRFALEYAAEQTNILGLGRKCGLVDIDSPEIDPWISAAISADRQSDSRILLPKDLAAIVSS